MQPVVSVVCLVYNHEKYLRNTLDGFVSQITDFPFEIVVHDDASTDGSRQIIEEYCLRYPELFVPVFQSENQHSKKVKISKTIVFPKCRGAFVAFCEGDDYWSDPNKLQLQVDYLRANPGCSMCVHDTRYVDLAGNDLLTQINGSELDQDYTANDVISSDGGGLFHYSSILARREAVDRPDLFDIQGVGDYPLAIYASICGDVHYFGRVMSCYRVGNSNSWSSRMEKNKDAFLDHCELVIHSLRQIDCYTDRKYHGAFARPIGRRLFVLYRYRYGFLRLLLKPQDLFYVLSVFFEKTRTFLLRRAIRSKD